MTGNTYFWDQPWARVWTLTRNPTNQFEMDWVANRWEQVSNGSTSTRTVTQCPTCLQWHDFMVPCLHLKEGTS